MRTCLCVATTSTATRPSWQLRQCSYVNIASWSLFVGVIVIVVAPMFILVSTGPSGDDGYIGSQVRCFNCWNIEQYFGTISVRLFLKVESPSNRGDSLGNPRDLDTSRTPPEPLRV